MKSWWIAALVAGLAVTFVSETADAKRLGGGRPAGMQRAVPDRPAQQTPATPSNTANTQPNSAAQPTTPSAGTAAPAAAPKRSWLGPVAGLAAGLGLAALFSHLGLGDELANFTMLMLLAIVALVAMRWLMRRFAGARPVQPAWAAAGASAASPSSWQSAQRASVSPALAVRPTNGHPSLGATHLELPSDFDAASFERVAKMIFIRLQAANDHGDVDDLRAFTTPELFASLRLDLQDRGSVAQRTDVVTLNADLLDYAQENNRQIVSVRFHGLVREESDAGAQRFDEVWHLVRPLGGDGSSWAIAGIQPRQ